MDAVRCGAVRCIALGVFIYSNIYSAYCSRRYELILFNAFLHCFQSASSVRKEDGNLAQFILHR